MMLTSLCEHVEKEQHHGVIHARETACRKRGGPAVPPYPQEGERSHATGVLCHHRLQSSLCSLPAPHVWEAGDPGPYETLSLADFGKALPRTVP